MTDRLELMPIDELVDVAIAHKNWVSWCSMMNFVGDVFEKDHRHNFYHAPGIPELTWSSDCVKCSKGQRMCSPLEDGWGLLAVEASFQSSSQTCLALLHQLVGVAIVAVENRDHTCRRWTHTMKNCPSADGCDFFGIVEMVQISTLTWIETTRSISRRNRTMHSNWVLLHPSFVGRIRFFLLASP